MLNKDVMITVCNAILGMGLAIFMIVAFAEATDGPNRSLCEPLSHQLKDKSIKGEKRDQLRKEFSEKCSYE